MGILYPGALDAFINPQGFNNMDNPAILHHIQHSDENDAIEAIEAKLGTGASTPAADTVLTGGAGGSSTWSPSGFAKLAETELAVAAASIDFSAIPQTYGSLLLVLTGRSDGAVVDAACWLQFNGDGGANYDYYNPLWDGSGAGAAAQTKGVIGNIPDASALADTAGILDVLIPHYAKTTFRKRWLARTGWHNSGGETAGVGRSIEGQWRNTGAITQITITPNSGNFVAGTIATLYGLA